MPHANERRLPSFFDGVECNVCFRKDLRETRGAVIRTESFNLYSGLEESGAFGTHDTVLRGAWDGKECR